MEEIEVFNQLSAIATPTCAVTFGEDSDRAIQIAQHKAWLGSIRRERPATNVPYKVGIYNELCGSFPSARFFRNG